MSGLMAAINKTMNGVPQVPNHAAADFATGITMAWAISAALFARERTGKGQKVEATLLATALALQTSRFTNIHAYDAQWMPEYLANLKAARDRSAEWDELANIQLNARPMATVGNIYYRTYKTKDGYIAVGNLSNALRKKMAGALGLHDPRFEDLAWDPTTPAAQAAGMKLVADAEALFETKTTDEWLSVLDAAGVPSGPVRFIEELFEDPQVRANDLVVELDHPLAGPLEMVGPIVKMTDTPTEVQGPSPALGQHTDELLARLGYDSARIAALKQAGVTR